MRTSLFLVFVSIATGCSRETTTSGAAPTNTNTTASDVLDRMDPRVPVPLLPMMANHQKQSMRDHLVAVQEIVTALAADDFAGIERAAGRIGYSEQMGQMCTHLGKGAPGFSELALDFHHTADRITSAAREHDRARVLSELGATLQRCTSCHATWKQQIVDEPTWERLTSAPAPHDISH